MGSYVFACPECGATIIADNGGGAHGQLTLYCTGDEDESHTAVEMEEEDDA
ncbi:MULTISPECIES: hypothetical protein [unclassified Halorubrum]|uniref:hypothetical protein n=1 Tax=unclassified Halorubrum TaxID=2642239 RepID=UPI0013051E20|nr:MULTISPECIES: hypothetical protein [unclassified Halorubrum]